ncbi:hypothetical protein [Lederbergia galactosidilytica]|uniref:Uncharacterized protein n=1 Tax=Lederbergia galactosidilytica TaxID=217031 RepID=A0A177ZM81_9BACI|nr:hypothetical protein [Lederbergia galactosidilytica]OAK69077.1 hypothetical protein ABB05_13975 [Lederbergia galactosidilytica]
MTYYAYFASHAPLSTEEIGYQPIRENVYASELDFTGLWFEENLDEANEKRYPFSQHVRLHYQTRCTSNYLPIEGNYRSNHTFYKKISVLLFEYILKALEDSPIVVYYISLDSQEDEEFTLVKTLHLSEIQSPEDFHINDRECLRIIRDDRILEYLEDESGFIYVKHPEYLQTQLKS